MSPSRSRRQALWLGPAALVVSTILGLIVLEVGLRLDSGRPVATIKLRPPETQLHTTTRDMTEFTSVVPIVLNTEPSWINVDPDPLPGRDRVDPELLAWRDLARDNEWRGFETNLYKQWNAAYLDGVSCDEDVDTLITPAPIYEFETTSQSPFPIFRYLPNRTDPLGLRTNRFAWRGPDIPLDKEPNTIRLAFAGASTTVGSKHCPASYPEYVVHWLNLWAQVERPDLKFDGINAGREGLTSPHIAAIIRDEILPMEPDLVFYYEGVNQLARWIQNEEYFDDLPRPKGDNRLALTSRYSELALRLREFILALEWDGAERTKPKHFVPWPRGVREKEPKVFAAKLPYDLTPIMHDLEGIRRLLRDNGSELAMGSFVFFAEDNMVLESTRDARIERFYAFRLWPLTYGEIRKLADFENRVFRSYSRDNFLGFVDLSGDYPRDPALFLDGVHFTCDGIRLQAWIVFQRLLPLVKGRIATDVWPRPDAEPLTRHPEISEPRLAESRCSPEPPTETLVE